eukprot:CAMPEP_0168788910 /NCGR_PEP_ID=MMETSP0725-20121227/12580_1 /TAXON_ID=265536 /ORGANISM="Amphiprora sp., Strain CCMP467" /LENGTH=148 /DNA_ID=CAMNT_0008839203 /DNA_START=149 /DNA_END=597 /DNA_ORIENTATION=-
MAQRKQLHRLLASLVESVEQPEQSSKIGNEEGLEQAIHSWIESFQLQFSDTISLFVTTAPNKNHIESYDPSKVKLGDDGPAVPPNLKHMEAYNPAVVKVGDSDGPAQPPNLKHIESYNPAVVKWGDDGPPVPPNKNHIEAYDPTKVKL